MSAPCGVLRKTTSTIDEICQERGIARIDLLKLGIEGAEKEVLANGRFLKWVRCGIVELHDNYEVEALKRDVSAWGFLFLEPSKERGLVMISVWPNSKLRQRQYGTCEAVMKLNPPRLSDRHRDLKKGADISNGNRARLMQTAGAVSKKDPLHRFARYRPLPGLNEQFKTLIRCWPHGGGKIRADSCKRSCC